MHLSVVSSPGPQYEDSQTAEFDVVERKDEERISLVDDIYGTSEFAGIIGQSVALRQVLQLVEMVAGSDATVLLLGETGTGKELVARAIHDRSQRHKESFITLNCAAIPGALFESELFGHERGAFTGAQMQRIGRLELADRGSLFLDEIGEMPLELQPKLLRALQQRTYERVGSARTKNVDMRLVAATNCDLEQMVDEKQFRPDLYYRLNVFPIRIPPLRERREDIPLLVQHFTQKYARKMGKQIEFMAASVMQKLMRWDWPGNVRELENLIERSVILTTGDTLMVSLPQKLNDAIDAAEVVGKLEEHALIVSILRETNGRISGPHGAALRLGLKRSTLLDRMKRLGINPREVRKSQTYAVA
jgi:formate hydrogenlyase transcriptional activator